MANIAPLYSGVPNVSSVLIGTTSAQVKSDGTSAGTGTDLMYCVWKSGANGSFLQSVRFTVATTLRIYWSSVVTAIGVAGATTNANTNLIAEVSVPIISASNSTNATIYYEVAINKAFPTGIYIMVSQHIAQTTNQVWKATGYGGDY